MWYRAVLGAGRNCPFAQLLQGTAVLSSAAAVGLAVGHRDSRSACCAEEKRGNKMKVVLCANAFKECISARQACEAMCRGVEAAAPGAHCVIVPMADGGDSTLEVLVEGCGGFFISGVTVQDPLGRPTKALYGMIDNGKTAVIEMAKASGLALLAENEKDALKTTTLGTGQLMQHALDLGAKRLILCIGGSATNDGGVGAAHALGYCFLDKDGKEVDPVGGRLLDITTIDRSGRDPRLEAAEVIVACDVSSPLCGPSGATAVYGPQKGATTPESRAILDKGLAHLAELWRTQLPGTPMDIATLPGSGAAGGLGGGAVAFFGAKFQSGFDMVANQVNLKDHLTGASLAITGEGRIDEQTGSGKVPYGVAVMAQQQGVPLCGIFGGIKDHAKIRRIPILGQSPIFSLCGSKGPMTLEEAMHENRAQQLIQEQAFNITRVFFSGIRPL